MVEVLFLLQRAREEMILFGPRIKTLNWHQNNYQTHLSYQDSNPQNNIRTFQTLDEGKKNQVFLNFLIKITKRSGAVFLPVFPELLQHEDSCELSLSLRQLENNQS